MNLSNKVPLFLFTIICLSLVTNSWAKDRDCAHYVFDPKIFIVSKYATPSCQISGRVEICRKLKNDAIYDVETTISEDTKLVCKNPQGKLHEENLNSYEVRARSYFLTDQNRISNTNLRFVLSFKNEIEFRFNRVEIGTGYFPSLFDVEVIYHFPQSPDFAEAIDWHTYVIRDPQEEDAVDIRKAWEDHLRKEELRRPYRDDPYPPLAPKKKKSTKRV